MHRAWQIAEVRRLIFEQCQPRDLALLAQCSSYLFDAATDELWGTLESFRSFCCCLPPDVRDRELRVEDLERLDFYCRKVRKICVEGVDNNRPIDLPGQFAWNKRPRGIRQGSTAKRAWKDVWTEIGQLRPQSEFLPNLRRLRVSMIVEELLFPLVGISGTKLEYMCVKHLHFREPQSVVRQFLDRVGPVPKLEYLFVRDGLPDKVPMKLVRDAPLHTLRLDIRVSQHIGHYTSNGHCIPSEIFRKSTLQNLTIGLTPEWNDPKIISDDEGASGLEGQSLDGAPAAHHKYLPALRKLWLNLVPLRGAIMSDLPRQQEAAVFFQKLDSPSLELLFITFRCDVTGTKLVETLQAASENCRLQNLTELSLAQGGNWQHCSECPLQQRPRVAPHELRKAFLKLLPLPSLADLRLTVAPNFLDVLDLKLYQAIADGLPALRKLRLGHPQFASNSFFEGLVHHERIALHHLAAFCRLLPNLQHVEAGCVDASALGKITQPEWICYNVKSLRVHYWVKERSMEREAYEEFRRTCILKLHACFPNSEFSTPE